MQQNRKQEVAYRMGYIDADCIRDLADPLRKNGYGKYLLQFISEQNEFTSGKGEQVYSIRD